MRPGGRGIVRAVTAMSAIRCACMNLPRAPSAPAANPCLFDPTGAEDPRTYSEQAPLPGGTEGVRLQCRNLGVTWMVDTCEDRYRAWIYDLAPESWPRLLQLIAAGAVEVASVAPLAALARDSGRVDLAEDLLLGAAPAPVPAGDPRLVARALEALDALPPVAREAGARIAALFAPEAADRAAAVGWLRRLDHAVDATVRGHVVRALVSALSDQDRAVAHAAARAIAWHCGLAPPLSRIGRAVYAHFRGGRPCDCFVLPRREQPRVEASCLGEIDHAGARLPPHYPHVFACRHTGIVWLAGPVGGGPSWGFVPAAASWPDIVARLGRGELTVANPFRAALAARAVGCSDVARALLEEGLGPEGLIGAWGERRGAEDLLAEVTARA